MIRTILSVGHNVLAVLGGIAIVCVILALVLLRLDGVWTREKRNWWGDK